MYTDDLAVQARTLRRQGLSRAQIRQALDLPPGRTTETFLWEALRDVPPPAWTARPNAKDDLRDQARALRLAGHSYNEIAALLGVSKSSCSLWLRDLPHPISPEEATRRRVESRRNNPATGQRRAAKEELRLATKLEAIDEIGELTADDRLLAGAITYWCEGAKPGRRSGRHVVFTNSDPGLFQLFLRFLDAVSVERYRLRFSLQIHEDADIPAALSYWRYVTGAEAGQFGKVTVKPAGKTNRKNVGDSYKGCLGVRVSQGAELFDEIESLAGRAFGEPGSCSLTDRQVKLLGALMYWCEGGKDKPYRRSERVTFINSDPEVIVFFLRFLQVVGIESSRIRFRIHIHENGDLPAASAYWSALAGAEESRFQPPTIKRHQARTVYSPEEQRLYRGCLYVYVTKSAELYRRIEGWAFAAMLGPEQAAARCEEAAARALAEAQEG
ncbi:hypothetical protein GCM10027589_30060 [Actinocorallia lasiicapitis]